MEIHNTFAYDLEAEDYATRVSVAVKTQQVLGTDRLSLTDTPGRRLSMVNIKEYMHEIKVKEYEQDRISEEDQEEEHTETDTKIDSSLVESKDGNDFNLYFIEKLTEVKDNEEDEKVPDLIADIISRKEEIAWFTPIRKLSFWELSEERFILALPEIENIPKESWIELIKSGKLIEENIANVKYLFTQTEVKETGDEFVS